MSRLLDRILSRNWDKADYYEMTGSSQSNDPLDWFDTVHTVAGRTMTASEYKATIPWLVKVRQALWPIPYRYAFWRWYRRFLWRHTSSPSLKAVLQRGIRGYGYSDHWNAKDYMVDVVIGVVSDLRKHNHGAPCVLYGPDGLEISTYLHPYEHDDESCDAYNQSHFSTWESILQDIVDGFQAHRVMNEGYKDTDGEWSWYRPDQEEYKLLRQKFDRAFMLLYYNFDGLWD